MTAAMRLTIDSSLQKSVITTCCILGVAYQWSAANTVNQQPWDERGHKEPSVQETGHESRKVIVEAQTL